MAKYTDADVLCPFYMGHSMKRCSITCEGMVPGSAVKHHFENGASLCGQLGKHCAGDYQRCPWAGMLYRKYGE